MILHRLHNMYKMSMHLRKKQGQKAALLDRKYIVENYNKLKSELSHPSGVTSNGKCIYRFNAQFSELARKWNILRARCYPAQISIFDKKTYSIA